MVTAGDDWDDYFPPFKTTRTSSLSKNCYSMYRMGWIKFGVVSPRQHFLYTPSLAGSAVGTILFSEVQVNPFVTWYQMLLPKVRQFIINNIRKSWYARYTDISNKRGHAITGSRDPTSPELEWSFDKLILIAISAQPNSFGILDVKEYVIFMKEVEESSKLQSRLLSNLEKVSA